MNQLIKRKQEQERKVTVGKIEVEREEEADGIFIQAVATIYIPIEPNGHAIMQRIHSGGILTDADSSEEYYEILGKEEIERVKYVLKQLGVKA